MASELAKHLYKRGAMDKETIKRVESNARQDNHSFYEQALKEEDVVIEPVLLAISELEKMAVVDIDRVNIDNLPLDLLPEKMIEDFQILPLSKHNNRIFVAIGNPNNKVALAQDLTQARFHTNPLYRPCFVTRFRSTRSPR
jgi:hypothetical protein